MHNTSANEIPFGEYCYSVVELEPGEQKPEATEDFGKKQRQAPWGRYSKRVLCQHWQATDHGTVRCEHLGLEAVVEQNYAENLASALEHFGSEASLRSVRTSATLLTDEIKICNTNLDDNGAEPFGTEQQE